MVHWWILPALVLSCAWANLVGHKRRKSNGRIWREIENLSFGLSEMFLCSYLNLFSSCVERCHNPSELWRHWQHARTHDHQEEGHVILKIFQRTNLLSTMCGMVIASQRRFWLGRGKTDKWIGWLLSRKYYCKQDQNIIFPIMAIVYNHIYLNKSYIFNSVDYHVVYFVYHQLRTSNNLPMHFCANHSRNWIGSSSFKSKQPCFPFYVQSVFIYC